jgi:hypothetical protein
MRKSVAFAIATTTGLLGLSSVHAQTTVFNDNFQNGSTVNGTSTPGGTPTASSTSYDIASSKTGQSTLSSGSLEVQLSSGTTSGFWEAQAVFSSSPITLETVNDYIDLTYTFTDTANLLAGGTSSYIFQGLFDDAGTIPVAGSLASAGLSTTTGSSFATGNAALWSGYAGRVAGSGGNQEIYSRGVQNGTGTTSANQELLGDGFGSGAYVNPTGTLGSGVGGTPSNPASTLALTTGSQYTMSYQIELSAANTLTVTENLFSGALASGASLGGATNSFSSVTDTSFDGLAIGARNSGTSFNPEMTISDINVTDFVQPVPEPSTFALAGLGLGLIGFARRFRRR